MSSPQGRAVVLALGVESGHLALLPVPTLGLDAGPSFLLTFLWASACQWWAWGEPDTWDSSLQQLTHSEADRLGCSLCSTTLLGPREDMCGWGWFSEFPQLRGGCLGPAPHPSELEASLDLGFSRPMGGPFLPSCYLHNSFWISQDWSSEERRTWKTQVVLGRQHFQEILWDEE